MPLLFTESLFLSLFLLATVKQKYYTHNETMNCICIVQQTDEKTQATCWTTHFAVIQTVQSF